MAKYRYRYKGAITRGAIARFDKVLAKLGHILYVRGYRYPNKYGTTDERVLVRGVNGTARFSGLLWGYTGEGPHGTRDLLLKLGVGRAEADEIAFRSPRLYPDVGEDWRVTFRPVLARRAA